MAVQTSVLNVVLPGGRIGTWRSRTLIIVLMAADNAWQSFMAAQSALDADPGSVYQLRIYKLRQG